MKRVLVLGYASLLLVALAAGGASVSVAAKKRLVVWGPTELQFKEVAKRFEKQNPGVEVSIQTGAVDKFYTMITAGLMPDLWGPWSTPGIRADVNRNWAVEIGSFIKRDGKSMNIDDFFPGVMRQFRVDGKQYSLPIFSYADYFFYNTQIWDTAGLPRPPLDSPDRAWTWERWVEYAQKMTKRDGTGKILVAGAEFNTWTASEPNFLSLWGVSPYGQDALRTAVPQKQFWDTPEMVHALTKAWDLMYRYKVAWTGNSAGQFAAGKVGSSIHAGPMINGYMSAKKTKWAIAPLPWAVTDSGTLWPDGFRIGRVSKNKELAWSFVKFICEPDNMRYIVSDPKSLRLGTPAARKSVFRETLGKDIGKATGMDPEGVFRVHAAMDEVGIVKLQETICLHTDIVPMLDATFQGLWLNKMSPAQAAGKLQSISDRALPALFKRWVRNIEFTGADKAVKLTGK